MQSNKSIYDMNREELKTKFNDEIVSSYSKFDYNENNWNKIIIIVNEFNEKILVTSFPQTLYNETVHLLMKVEKNKEKQKVSDVIFDNIILVLSKVGKTIATAYNTIKFVFSIFALTFSSVAITVFIHLLLGLFIYGILPNFITPFILQSFLSAFLFIKFRVSIFVDRDDNDIYFDPKVEIIKFASTIPFYAAVFLIFTFMDDFPVLENILPIFYPHMWLSCFTGEYVYSPMIALSLNCIISILIYLLIKRRDRK